MLYDMAYNARSLVGTGVENAIRAGDRAEAWWEIRYNSGAANDYRRYADSQIFGLYSNNIGGEPSLLEALQAFRMGVMKPGMSAPVLVFGVDLFDDPDHVEQKVSSEEDGSWRSLGLMSEDGSMKFTRWEGIDHHIPELPPHSAGAGIRPGPL